MTSSLSAALIAITFATTLPAPRPRSGRALPISQNQPASKTPGDLKLRLERIEQSVETMRKQLGIPGLSLVIVKDDRVIYLKGFGLRDVERDLPVTTDTLFAIGSTTKAFTSMLAMISVDQGKLSLDDSPRRFLPYFKLRDPTANAQSTLRDLFCHRTGLISYSDFALATGQLNRRELIQVMGLAKPTARFREKFQYNNVMFSAAGEAVARANQTTWEELISQLIFKPLGMTETSTSIAQMQTSTDFSRGYSMPDAAGKNHTVPTRDLSAIAPSGAINSNASELAHWLRLLLSGGVFNGKRLVSSSSFAELWRPQIHVREHVDYGLGWVLADWNGLRLVLHNGGYDGFHSLIEMVRGKNIGFALLANVDSPTLDAEARRIIWGNLFDIELKKSSSAATSSSVSKTNLDELVGTYKDPAGGGSAEMSLKDGKLVLTLPGQPAYALIAKSPDEFRVAELPASYSLRVKRIASGIVASIVLVEPEGLTELKRYDQRAKPFVTSMSIKKLMRHMVAAAGGEANLRKHRTMLAAIAVDFENHGVKGYGVVSARAPNSEAIEITLSALDKTIGNTREYFDGSQGGEEFSFNPTETWKAGVLENKKIEADFYNQLLDWSTLFQSVRILRVSKNRTEPVFVVEKIAANGTSVIDYVSTRTFDLLRRESAAGPDSDRVVESFSDFRIVDGVRIPFRTLQQSEQLGNVTIVIKKLRFNVDLPAKVFLPKQVSG